MVQEETQSQEISDRLCPECGAKNTVVRVTIMPNEKWPDLERKARAALIRATLKRHPDINSTAALARHIGLSVPTCLQVATQLGIKLPWRNK